MPNRPRPTRPPRYPVPKPRSSQASQIYKSLTLDEKPLLHSHDEVDHHHGDSSSSSSPSPPHSPLSVTSRFFSLPHVTSSRFMTTSFPMIVLLIILAAVMTPVLISYVPRFLHPSILSGLLLKSGPRPGVTIIAACSNRHPMLARTVVSWMQVSLARQILIIDWSSSPPLRETVQSIVTMHAPLLANITPPEIRVVRVADEPAWVLSRAYNLAAQLSQFDTIFKVDCDYLLHPEVALAHVLPKEPVSFYAGNVDNARSINELYLNGVLIAPRELFLSVGGYDERIQTYGYEDEELYSRLSAAGALRRNISYDMVDHILHHDSSRISKDMPFPRVQMEVNQKLLEKVGEAWNGTRRHGEFVRMGGGSGMLRASYTVPDLRTLVAPEQLAEIRATAISSRLHDDFGIPWLFVHSLVPDMMERLLRKVILQREGMRVEEEGSTDLKAKLMVVHVQNGIGNRLRVLGSGLAFAESTNRVPIVIWEPDVQFGAFFAEVFNMSFVKYVVADSFNGRWPLIDYAKKDATWNSFIFHNYMLEEHVGLEVENVPGKNIYFKSPAIMNSAVTSWETENNHIRDLVIVDDIEAMATKAYSKFHALHIGGVHIRNRSLDFDIPGLKTRENRKFYYQKDMMLIDKWRAYTKLSNFLPTMKQMLKNNTVSHFFIASDTIAVCKKLQNLFGNRTISFIDRQCDDRGSRCAKFAMADLIVLSKTRPLLGSTWSSFTEAAMRLGGPKALLAGTDFGEGPPPPPSPSKSTPKQTKQSKTSSKKSSS